MITLPLIKTSKYELNMVAMALLFVSTVTLPKVNSQNFQVIYWELKPYIWVENGELDGILPFMLHKAKAYCDKQNSVEITFSVNLNTFTHFEEVLSNIGSNKHGEGKLANITNLHPVIWFPYPVSIRKRKKRPHKNRELHVHNVVTAPSVSIIIKRDHIELTRKIFYGVYTCIPLVLQGFLCSVIAAIVIWVAERVKNPKMSKTFIKGTGTSLWWSHVTVTTTGFGDLVPVTIIGRCVASIWMISGIFAVAVITATLTESVDGISGLDIYEESIAVLKYSHEERIARENFQGNQDGIKAYESYQEVIQAVRDGTCFAALINSDVATWYQNKLRNTKDVPLVVIKNIPLEIPVHLLMSQNAENNTTENFFNCMFNQYADEIITWTLKHFKRHQKIETLYRPKTISDAVTTEVFLILTVVPLIMITLGLLYDVLARYRKNSTLKIYHN